MQDEQGGTPDSWPDETDPQAALPGPGSDGTSSAGPGTGLPVSSHSGADAVPGGPGTGGQAVPGQGYPGQPLPGQAYPSRPAPALPGDRVYAESGQPTGSWPPEGGYGPSGGYGASGYGPSGGYVPPGGYAPPGGYVPPGGYAPPGGYVPPGGYPPPGGYGPPGGYPPPGGYVQGPPPRRRRGIGLIAYVLVAVLAAGAGAGTVAWLDNSPTAASHLSQPAASGGNGAATGPNSATTRSVIRAVEPGLVDISSHLGYEGGAAAATGMVISSNGLVLTNNHVIDGTTNLTAVVVATNQKFAARWLGFDKTADVAVIKLIGAHGLKTVPLGNSAKIRLGASVVALGNAYGAGSARAVTGSITGLDKRITASDGGANSETLTGMLQTSANIVPGDSGGALADAAGQVIGMNTAAATGGDNPQGGFGNTPQNIAFAIPINRAVAIARQIIAGRSSAAVQIGSTGFLGVLVPAGQASSSDNPAAQRRLQLQQDQPGLGFPVQRAGTTCLPNDQNAGVPNKIAPAKTGALIIGELCGTPAAKGGLVAGDVITAVGKYQVTSPEALTNIMLNFRPGNSVSVRWEGVNGQAHRSSLILIQAPPH